MLGYQWYAMSGKPVVFLHGLLGSQHDWASTFAHLQNIAGIRPLAFDLPCHATSQKLSCQSFLDFRQQLHSALTTLIHEPFWLVGYSLGGRLALDYTFHQPNPHLLGTLVEGANIGLQTEAERQVRWQNDRTWAQRFRTEPIEKVLADWYRQPVFADLTDNKRSILIKKRQQNDGNKIAEVLETTSLAIQPNFRQQTWQNIHFLIGERDHKFRQMAEQNALPYRLIAHAGHNAHWENPIDFAAQLIQIIEGKHNGTASLP